MAKLLRSLSGLLDFESAARWNSFKLAAKELHKTPAAISQQIKGLEEQLGFALFERHPRHVELTEQGEALAATLTRTLGEISDTMERLRIGADENVLRVSVPHSLSMKWLVPRLPRFTARHPQVDIRIDNRDRPVDLDTDPFDLALRITEQKMPANAVLLGQEDQVPVYSPVLEEEYGGPLDLAALNQLPLLYQESPEHWLRWLRDNRCTGGEHDFAHSFSHSGILVQAAVAGQGIGLVPYAIACDDLQRGVLKQLPGSPGVSPDYYYAVPSIHSPATRNLGLFTNWLLEEFREMERKRDYS